jgi:hypothetical protein
MTMAQLSNELADLLSAYPTEVRSLALKVRELVLSSIPNAIETVDGKARVVGYGYGTRYVDTIFTIILSKTGVKLGIVNGVELPDPKGLMQGAGKRHRHVQISESSDLQRPGLKALLKTAVGAWHAKYGGR